MVEYNKILIVATAAAIILVIMAIFRVIRLEVGADNALMRGDLNITVPNCGLVMPCDGKIVHVDETESHYRLIIKCHNNALYFPANGQLAPRDLYVNDPEEDAHDAARYIRRGGVLLGKNYNSRPFNSVINKPQNNYYVLLNNGPVVHLSNNAEKDKGHVARDFNAGDFLTEMQPIRSHNSLYVSFLFPKMDYSDGYFKFSPNLPDTLAAGEVIGHYAKNRFSMGLANSEYEDVYSIGPWGLYLNAIFAQGPKN